MSIKNLESLRPAMAELERAVVWAGQRIDNVPFKLVPVIQTKGRKAKCTGWYSADQWSTREGEDVHEITFCAEELNTDPVDIVAIAVHEVIHFWTNYLELKDMSTGGRHNKVFKEYAEIMGLECAKPYDSYGYGYTTPTEELRKRIEKGFKPDVAAFNLFRLVKPSTAKPVKTNAWICDCDNLTVRIPAKQTLDATCHKCNEKFVPKDGAEVERDDPLEPESAAEIIDNAVEELAQTESNDEELAGIECTPAEVDSTNATITGVGHTHSEGYGYHEHGGFGHGNEDIAEDPNLDHDEDAGIIARAHTEDMGVAVPEEPKPKRSHKKKQ